MPSRASPEARDLQAFISMQRSLWLNKPGTVALKRRLEYDPPVQLSGREILLMDAIDWPSYARTPGATPPANSLARQRPPRPMQSSSSLLLSSQARSPRGSAIASTASSRSSRRFEAELDRFATINLSGSATPSRATTRTGRRVPRSPESLRYIQPLGELAGPSSSEKYLRTFDAMSQRRVLGTPPGGHQTPSGIASRTLQFIEPLSDMTGVGGAVALERDTTLPFVSPLSKMTTFVGGSGSVRRPAAAERSSASLRSMSLLPDMTVATIHSGSSLGAEDEKRSATPAEAARLQRSAAANASLSSHFVTMEQLSVLSPSRDVSASRAGSEH